MNKFYEINDLISLSNYAKKYNITLRKIYRYISDGIIEHYIVDGVAYLYDSPIKLLKESHTRNQLLNSVKILTKCELSVKNLTEYDKVVENQEVNSVKILTETQTRILNTTDNKLNAEGLERKYKILKKIDEIKLL
jgi:hypothetical protein